MKFVKLSYSRILVCVIVREKREKKKWRRCFLVSSVFWGQGVTFAHRVLLLWCWLFECALSPHLQAKPCRRNTSFVLFATFTSGNSKFVTTVARCYAHIGTSCLFQCLLSCFQNNCGGRLLAAHLPLEQRAAVLSSAGCSARGLKPHLTRPLCFVIIATLCFFLPYACKLYCVLYLNTI